MQTDGTKEYIMKAPITPPTATQSPTNTFYPFNEKSLTVLMLYPDNIIVDIETNKAYVVIAQSVMNGITTIVKFLSDDDGRVVTKELVPDVKKYRHGILGTDLSHEDMATINHIDLDILGMYY